MTQDQLWLPARVGRRQLIMVAGAAACWPLWQRRQETRHCRGRTDAPAAPMAGRPTAPPPPHHGSNFAANPETTQRLPRREDGGTLGWAWWAATTSRGRTSSPAPQRAPWGPGIDRQLRHRLQHLVLAQLCQDIDAQAPAVVPVEGRHRVPQRKTVTPRTSLLLGVASTPPSPRPPRFPSSRCEG